MDSRILKKAPRRGQKLKAGRLMALLISCAMLFMLPGAPASAASRGGHCAAGSSEPAKQWYFAEGTTRQGFQEYICLYNPGGSVSIVNITYMLNDGRCFGMRCDLAPGSRSTIDVNTQVPQGVDLSFTLDASEPVIAERAIYFDNGGVYSGGDITKGACSPLDEWYFAEGCTRNGFETYLCIFNPSDKDAEVDIDYYRGDGKSETRNGIVIPKKSRFTVPVHQEGPGIGRIDGPGGDVAMKVRSANGVGVVAERPVYFRYKDWICGSHTVVGAASPAKKWYFAEGCTRNGFDTYLCLSNPGEKEAKVRISYSCGNGDTQERRGIVVAPLSRLTIPVFEPGNGIGRSDGPGGDVSIIVESENEVPVVAERPVYFSYRPFWTGGHDVTGVLEPEAKWYFAEGCTRLGYNTYLCIANPSAEEAVVLITFKSGDGGVTEKRNVEVAGHTRLTVAVHDPVQGFGSYDDNRGDVSTTVESLNGVKVVTERCVYFADKWRTIDRGSLAAAWRWGEVSSGNRQKNSVALTFDMETNGALGSQLLDILKLKNVRATCFLLGNYPSQYPGLVIRMAAEGHEIGSHGVTHSFFTGLSYEQVDRELDQVESEVKRLTGFSTMPYFRFPGGDRNAALIRHVNSRGYLSVFWSVDPQEWSGKSAGQVQAEVIKGAGNGAIILMHDKPKTIEALPGIIDGLRSRGFNLVPLSETLWPGP